MRCFSVLVFLFPPRCEIFFKMLMAVVVVVVEQKRRRDVDNLRGVIMGAFTLCATEPVI